MEKQIGLNAGAVWRALSNGPLAVKDLKKATKLTDKGLFAALGWLAREGKVHFTETEKDIIVGLV